MDTVVLNDVRLTITVHLENCSDEHPDLAPRWFVQFIEESPDPGAADKGLGYAEFLMVDADVAKVRRVFDRLDDLVRFTDPGAAEGHAALLDAVSALGDDEGVASGMRSGPYLVIEEVKLEPQYRGRGLGTYLTGMALKMIAPGCDVVLVSPRPLDQEDGEFTVQPATDEAVAAIGRSWERLGFRQYRHRAYVLDRSSATFEDSLAELRRNL